MKGTEFKSYEQFVTLFYSVFDYTPDGKEEARGTKLHYKQLSVKVQIPISSKTLHAKVKHFPQILLLNFLSGWTISHGIDSLTHFLLR